MDQSASPFLRLPWIAAAAFLLPARAAAAQDPPQAESFVRHHLADILPPVLFEMSVLDILLWQWAAVMALVLVAWGLSWLVTAVIVRALGRLVQRSRTTIDDHLLDVVGGPIRLAIAAAVYAGSIRAVGLDGPAQRFFDQAGRVAVLAALGWLLLRLIDVVAGTIEEQLRRRGQVGAAAVVPLGQRTVKAVVLALLLLAVLQNFGFNVTGLLAGLGVGGLAVALAAQKTVENLFGGLTLIADQPVRVGDFCRFGDQVGTVEEIGLRSTRIRTLDRTVVSIPNAEFSALRLENFARRDRIWLKTTVGVRYETTPDQLRYLLVEIKKMLVAHPKILADPARVRFAGFGASSLDLEIFAYVATSDINEFLAVREDIFLRIMDIVAAAGTGFAFPSQTLYVASDEGLDAERAAAAASQVKAWREGNSMPLPWLPASRQGELAGTLDYPPRGSAPADARA